MTTSAWTVTAVDAATGANPTSIPGAVVQRLIPAINESGVADLTLRRNDPNLAEFRDPEREFQIRRDGTLLLWGPAARVEIDQDRATIQLADPAWYLTRRFFGRADRINFLTNGDFEDGLTEWATVGSVAAVIDPTHNVQGGRSVRLTATSAGHDTYLHQTYTHTQVHPAGDLLTIAAWVFIPAADYQGDATGSLGLFAIRRNAADDIVDIAGDAADDHPALIDGRLLKDQWVRLETTLEAVKEGDTVEVRLYPPFGVAWWDLITLTEMESLSFIEQDMATIVRGVVRYAQDQFVGFVHGKSDVNLDVDLAPTGVTLTRVWQFADHQNIAGELDKFTEMRGGIDWAVRFPDDTSRVFVAGHPHLGDVRDDITLEWGVNVSKFRYSWERAQAATSSVVLGAGDGPDREEGGAVLPGAVGPTLEDVTVAPDGTPPGALDRTATERLAVLANPEILQLVCVGVIGVINVGDWVPVLIDWIDDTYRVVRMEINPANDSATLTCNLRDPETPEEAMARFPRAVDACLAPGGGVWVVGSDGGVGAFGAADFHGSLPDDGIIPNAPVVAIVPHGADGYWLVAADTGIFAYGDAPTRLPYTAMITTEYAQGDRAVVAAEAYDPGGDDTLIMIADDGATYIGDVP